MQIVDKTVEMLNKINYKYPGLESHGNSEVLAI